MVEKLRYRLQRRLGPETTGHAVSQHNKANAALGEGMPKRGGGHVVTHGNDTTGSDRNRVSGAGSDVPIEARRVRQKRQSSGKKRAGRTGHAHHNHPSHRVLSIECPYCDTFFLRRRAF